MNRMINDLWSHSGSGTWCICDIKASSYGLYDNTSNSNNHKRSHVILNDVEYPEEKGQGIHILEVDHVNCKIRVKWFFILINYHTQQPLTSINVNYAFESVSLIFQSFSKVAYMINFSINDTETYSSEWNVAFDDFIFKYINI